MTRIIPIRSEKYYENFFKIKKIVNRPVKFPVDAKEMAEMNERLAKNEQEFRSKSAESSMAVRRFLYNA